MIRRPPRSTLTDPRVPYTTLFRSRGTVPAARRNAAGATRLGRRNCTGARANRGERLVLRPVGRPSAPAVRVMGRIAMRFPVLLTVLAALLFPISDAAAQSMLETVRQRGHLKCGVSQGLPGFSYADDKGRWSDLDVDFCRAVAAAVLGDAAKLQFTPLSAKDRFTALQSGEIRSEEHTSELQSLMRISYAVFCLKKKKKGGKKTQTAN